MSQNHPSPEDREPLSGAGADPRRLADVERRLKAARPRPAELDTEAILLAARSPGQPAALPEPSAERRRMGTCGWIVTVAGSWACGAIAGALATFILLSRDAPSESPFEGMSAMTEEKPVGEGASGDGAQRPARDDSLPKASPIWSPSDSLALITLIDPYDCGPTRCGGNRSVLRAPDFAHRQDTSDSSRFRHWIDTTSQNWADTMDTGADAIESITPRAARARSTVQEQLLHELLGASWDSIW